MNVWGDSTHHLKRQLDHCTHFRTTMQQSHTTWNTIAYLWRQNVILIEPDMWPPNSPDLNPVNYTIGWSCTSCCMQFTSAKNRRILPTHSNVTSKIVVGFTLRGPPCIIVCMCLCLNVMIYERASIRILGCQYRNIRVSIR